MLEVVVFHASDPIGSVGSNPAPSRILSDVQRFDPFQMVQERLAGRGV
uniref:Uncharacterized protein n=1 Tax=Nelumbo nucifera TaxID=4432 RepID=A0A822ZBF3_NELNU|nr:TPA_asm: hypothetical protein HUJ06_014689 [Nelumbo nucifera]